MGGGGRGVVRRVMEGLMAGVVDGEEVGVVVAR